MRTPDRKWCSSRELLREHPIRFWDLPSPLFPATQGSFRLPVPLTPAHVLPVTLASHPPAATALGLITIRLTANDGQPHSNLLSRSFALTFNQPPSISPITNQITALNTPPAPIPFSINDAETPASNLTIFASCTNSVLV